MCASARNYHPLRDCSEFRDAKMGLSPSRNARMTDSRNSACDRSLWPKRQRRFQFSLRSLLLITLAVSLLFSCVANLPAIIRWAYGHWQVGRQYDQCTFEGAGFRFRITAFRERGAFLGAPGGYYRYEVKKARDWRWREILMYRVAAPDPIPPNPFRHVTESCAYFFQDDLFAITRDGGSSWTFRGGAGAGLNYPQFSAQQLDSRACIESLTINEDGTGAVQLRNYDYVKMKPLPSQRFETSDFGISWQQVRDGLR